MSGTSNRRVSAARMVVACLGVCLVLAVVPDISAQAPATKAMTPTPGARAAYKPVEWDVLGGFALDPFASSAATARSIPAQVKALDSTKVIVGGYMLPFEFGGKGVTYFALTESLDSCGFGELLTPTNWIATAMPQGKWATYHEFMYVQVFGTLRVSPYYQDGQLSNIYYMAADSVRIAR